ncbi:hypothetical protein AC579_1971 [Pseudocercospora musae]|uniref:Amino acid permease/ SLC12A domain-containing protein n=1 Tax=Pseudocercospora musae TaxID=113226 RepID=A0A139I8L6_9PEZI|nr:hypothetical protein AC579_1971 [Pseudocercospora musae]
MASSSNEWKGHGIEAAPEKRDLAPVISYAEGDLKDINDHHIEDGQYKRSFSTHHVHIISLGSNIGSGLFIGTGSALASGGPGNMVIAYALVCSCVWAALQSLTEMTIAFPVSGSFIDYADRWVDPALAFGAGFAEWLGWTAIVGAEAAFFNILVQFWAEGSFPQAASLTLFTGATCAIFLMPNRVFAWFEYCTSLVKVFMFLLVIVVGLAITLGAGPDGYLHTGQYWTSLPAFKNGFSGFANAMILATWAVGDQIFIGVMGGEAKNPRLSMGHACKLVPYRVSFFYMSCVVFITLLVPSDDPNLLGGKGVTASPFIIAIQKVNIKGLPHLLNACMMFGIMAIAAESIYLSSRMLRTMAHQRLIPGWVAKCDSKGRPRVSLAVTCASGVLFTYINLSSGGKVALNWLVQITAASFYVNWIIVSFTSWRFRRALQIQQDPLFQQLYAWKMTSYPTPLGWLLTICGLLLISSFTLAIKAPGAILADFKASNFFQYTLGIWLIVLATVGYKLICRTPWRKLEDVDLTTGRRQMSEEDIAELNHYYSQSKARRFLSYIQLW